MNPCSMDKSKNFLARPISFGFDVGVYYICFLVGTPIQIIFILSTNGDNINMFQIFPRKLHIPQANLYFIQSPVRGKVYVSCNAQVE
ncbi:MAG: hypothetical protein EZS28_045849 [Streblomastix strix]|uniref:Uncharacterized protein n=1 Tax=Streblomastix strix TaxID=222440 RepID=A0A5J4TJT2_9EUKA|nr:MAG: hypothetical protein EZS28_045849 [Streblomastix strix]